MSYVDGYVFTIQKKNLQKYQKMAKDAGKIWKKYGALSYMECVGDDLKPMMGMLPFRKLTKAKPNEIVLYSFIVYKTKADRNRINKKIMKEMEEQYGKQDHKDMPFDLKKMAFGGFKSIVDL